MTVLHPSMLSNLTDSDIPYSQLVESTGRCMLKSKILEIRFTGERTKNSKLGASPNMKPVMYRHRLRYGKQQRRNSAPGRSLVDTDIPIQRPVMPGLFSNNRRAINRGTTEARS